MATKYIDITVGNLHTKKYIYRGNSVFIKYSANATTADMHDTQQDGDTYIGFYIGQEVSGVKSDYAWSEFVGKDGEDGEDGAAGATGNGIASITLVSTSGVEKTYKIVFTNGNEFSYIVSDGTNGRDGNDGTDGRNGNKWFSGEDITGGGTQTSTGYLTANEDDWYLNTNTGEMYVCTDNSETTTSWLYKMDIYHEEQIEMQHYRAFIVSGATPFTSGWLSETSGGTALSPATKFTYIVRTSGEYYNKMFVWNTTSSRYEYLADGLNYTGEWEENGEYYPDDAVYDDAGAFRCHTAISPSTTKPENDTAHFEAMYLTPSSLPQKTNAIVTGTMASANWYKDYVGNVWNGSIRVDAANTVYDIITGGVSTDDWVVKVLAAKTARSPLYAHLNGIKIFKYSITSGNTTIFTYGNWDIWFVYDDDEDTYDLELSTRVKSQYYLTCVSTLDITDTYVYNYTIGDSSITANDDLVFVVNDILSEEMTIKQRYVGLSFVIKRNTKPSDAISYSYKLKRTSTAGQDILINTYAYKNLVTENRVTNTSVPTSSWVADATYTAYPYKASIAITGVTTNSVAEVVYGLTEATSGTYAPICATGNGYVYIYASSIPASAITIPLIKISEV